MTWNTLANLAAGDVVTEEDMDHIRENIDYLYALPTHESAGYEVLANSTTETAMGAFTIAANDLGAYGMVKGVWVLLTHSDAGGGRTTTYEAYLGATSLFSGTLALNASSYGLAIITAYIANGTATNAQIAGGDFNTCVNMVAGTPKTPTSFLWYNTAAIDTTAACLFEAHVTQAFASADYWTKVVFAGMYGPYLASS